MIRFSSASVQSVDAAPMSSWMESGLETSQDRSRSRSIAFIDRAVTDYQSLVAGIASDVEVHVLDSQNAIAQITQTLLGRTGIASLHIISHGNAGEVQLGSDRLNAQTLKSYSSELQTWTSALTGDADILLYGCNVATGELGATFVHELAALTQADIAASVDLTGNIRQGGDWELETNVGEITAPLALSPTAQGMYQGTLEGPPVQVTQIVGVTAGANPKNLTDVNGKIFFSATNEANGEELWVSDGTEAGTRLVKDLATGSRSSKLSNFINVNGLLYFTAADPQSGKYKLWKSDGTDSGTQLALSTDLGENIQNLMHASGMFYFTNTRSTTFYNGSTYSPEYSTDLFQYDSLNPSGELKSLGGEKSSSDAPSISNLYVIGDSLVYTANQYKLVVKDLRNLYNSGTSRDLSGSSFPGQEVRVSNFLATANNLYFVVDNGNQVSLQQLNGSNSTIHSLSAYNLPVGGSRPTIENLVYIGNTLYFTTTEPSQGNQFWQYNPNSYYNSPQKVWLSGGDYASITNLTNVNGTLYFMTNDTSKGLQLWRWRSTDYQPSVVKTIDPQVSDTKDFNFTAINGTLYFTTENGRKLWQSNGMENGTTIVSSAPNNQVFSSSSKFTVSNGKIFFTADDGKSGTELWMNSINQSGNQLVKDINLSKTANPDSFTSINGTVYLIASEAGPGKMIWQVTVNPQESQPNMALMSGQPYFGPASLIQLNQELYSITSDGSTGLELWKITGSSKTLVKDINPGSGSSIIPSSVRVLNGKMYFQAYHPDSGVELWVSDGTSNGTQLLKEIATGRKSSSPEQMVAVGNTVYFIANDDQVKGLWKTDGTSSGTQFITKVDASISQLTEANGLLFFTMSTRDEGKELWKSDGTFAGTQLVRNIGYGSESSNPEFLTSFRGKLFFWVSRWSGGNLERALWVSDGTDSGTTQATYLYQNLYSAFSSSERDIPIAMTATREGLFVIMRGNTTTTVRKIDTTFKGSTSVAIDLNGSGPITIQNLVDVNGEVYFIAQQTRWDGMIDQRIFATSGTGIREVSNLWNITNPSKLFYANGQLFFTGQSNSDGVQVWSIKLQPTASSNGNVPGEILAVADMNRDGENDIIGYDPRWGDVGIWQMNGTSVSQTILLPKVPDFTWKIVGTADFDGDGDRDILWRNNSTGQNHFWRFNGSLFQDSVALSTVDMNWQIVGLTDLDGDQKVDIFWRNLNNGQNIIWKLDGMMFDSSFALSTVDNNWSVAGLADFDGDQKADIFWRHTQTGQNIIWKLNGTRFDSSFALSSVDSNWAVESLSDIDGDGKVDILWRNRTYGDNVVWKMNGPQLEQGFMLRYQDANWSVRSISRRNGKTQILWYNPNPSNPYYGYPYNSSSRAKIVEWDGTTETETTLPFI